VKSKPNGLIVLAALGAAAVAYVVLVFVPGHKAIMELRARIVAKRSQVLQVGSLASAIELSKKDLARAKACIAAWDANAPNEKDLAVLFGRINELAKAAGAVNTRFEPEPVRRRERLVEIPLSIGLLGSFGQIEAFVHSLERLPATIWVDSVKIASTKDAEPVQGEVRLVVFTANSENSDYVKLAGKPIN
jgi:Tfp pilus assembly protein PilO